MSELFSKISSISDEYEYSNIQIKLPSDIIRIHISGVRIYSDIYLLNVWHSDIRLVHNLASEYIRIFFRVHFMIFAHNWVWVTLLLLCKLEEVTLLEQCVQMFLLFLHWAMRKVFWRIKGLTIKNESNRQRKVELSPEGLANSKLDFFNGFSHSAVNQNIF